MKDFLLRQLHADMETQVDQGNLAKMLEEKSTLIETILQNLPIGIAVNKMDDGKASVVNNQFSEIYGWPGDDLADVESFFKKVYPDAAYRNEIISRIMSDIKSADPMRMSWNGLTVTTNKGEKRIVNAKKIPLYDQNLMISTVTDVTTEFNQANELKSAKAKQDALINGTPDLIWSVDTEYRLIAANESFRQLMKTLSGKTIREGDNVLIKEFGVEQISKWKLLYGRAFKGERFTVKDQYYNPVKQIMEHTLISLSPMFNEENVLAGVICYSRDTTEYAQKIRILEKSKANLEKIMDSSMDMICSIDAWDNILSVSAASEAILGYKPEELTGKKLFDFVYPPDREKTEQTAKYVIAGHSLTNFENRYVRKDGSVVPLIWSVKWDPKDKVRYGIARDATEIKKSEAALIESEKIYKYLFNKNPLPIFIWDFATHRIIDCNEEAVRKYGFIREEILLLNINDLRAPLEQPTIQEFVETGKSLDGFYRGRRQHKKKNGEIIFVDITGQLMDFRGKKIAMSIVNDITESRHYQEMDNLEKNILEMAAKSDKSLGEIIDIYLTGVEALHPGMLCSIQEKRGNKLYNLSSPSLPAEYLETIRGVEIADNVGSCGTAAFLKQKVIVTDISTDVRWANYKEVAGKYQLKTCWSFPILDRKNNVLATLACYYREIKAPAEREEKTIERVGQIIQTIFESYQREHALQISNERFEHAAEAASEIIWDWELDTDAVHYSGNMKKLFGHQSGLIENNLPFYFDHVHPDDREKVVLYPNEVKYGTMVDWTQEYRFRKADGNYAYVLDKGTVVRDENGLGLRMIGAMQDITSIKENEMRITQQNQRLMEIALINAHEIRRPVATILGLMQLINKKMLKEESDGEIIDHLETVTQELDDVIRRIIDKTVN